MKLLILCLSLAGITALISSYLCIEKKITNISLRTELYLYENRKFISEFTSIENYAETIVKKNIRMKYKVNKSQIKKLDKKSSEELVRDMNKLTLLYKNKNLYTKQYFEILELTTTYNSLLMYKKNPFNYYKMKCILLGSFIKYVVVKKYRNYTFDISYDGSSSNSEGDIVNVKTKSIFY